jgi:hypothetical protein
MVAGRVRCRQRGRVRCRRRGGCGAFFLYVGLHFPRNPVEPVIRMVLSRKHPATATASMASYVPRYVDRDRGVPEDIGDDWVFLEARAVDTSRPGRGCACVGVA